MNLPAFERFREWVQITLLSGIKGRECDVIDLDRFAFLWYVKHVLKFSLRIMQQTIETILQDASYRIESAELHYGQFLHELDNFAYEHIERMLKTDGNGEFYIGINPPSELVVAGVASVLAAKIAEDLRSALDYSVFALSMQNFPKFNQKLSQFVIADSKKAFDSDAKRCLKYLTEEQKEFIENLQPFHANVTLGLIRDATNTTKHRRLLHLQLQGSSEIAILSPGMENETQYQDWRIFKPQEGIVVAAKYKKQAFRFLEHYEAIQTLRLMIDSTVMVVQTFASHLIGGRRLPSVIYR